MDEQKPDHMSEAEWQELLALRAASETFFKRVPCPVCGGSGQTTQNKADELAALTQRCEKLEAASKDVLTELDIIRNHQPRVSLIVHIDTHEALRAALHGQGG